MDFAPAANLAQRLTSADPSDLPQRRHRVDKTGNAYLKLVQQRLILSCRDTESKRRNSARIHARENHFPTPHGPGGSGLFRGTVVSVFRNIPCLFS
jgi:hypothetical protein